MTLRYTRLMKFHKIDNSLLLLFSWLLIGSVTTVAGFLGLLYWPLSFMLLLPIGLVLFHGYELVKKVINLRQQAHFRTQRFLVICLGLVWLLHATGIWVPETGFDAVWYHLPIVHRFVEHHRIYYIIQYYQSLNPLFTDLIFLLGYQIGGEIGAKFVAYLFGLSLIILSYRLARLVVPPVYSLLTVLLISSFQVVAWQASSFYIDVAKALFEIGALYFLLKQVSLPKKTNNKEFVLSAWSFGASLASKLFSILLIPVFGVIVAMVYLRNDKQWRQGIIGVGLFLGIAVSIALPYYIFSYYHTLSPIHAIEVPLKILGEIGGESNLVRYLVDHFIKLPFSLWYFVISKDYISPLLIFFLPLGLYHGWKYFLGMSIKKNNASHQQLIIMALFTLSQWIIWWFLPPLSTRYALSGFIVLGVLVVKLMYYFKHSNLLLFRTSLTLLILAIVLNLLPRLVVTGRNLKYIFTNQTRTHYLEQFYDGNIDASLKSWQKLYQKP